MVKDQNWNDGKMEYWNIGLGLHRIDKYHELIESLQKKQTVGR